MQNTYSCKGIPVQKSDFIRQQSFTFEA